MSIGGATFDLFVRTGRTLTSDADGRVSVCFPLGSKVRVRGICETCGGGAANTAVGLKRLGFRAGFCGIVGSDQWGEKMLENLKREGVDSSCATIVEGETSSFSVILSVETGERVILYEPGTNAHLHDVTFDRERVALANWVYLNRLLEQGCEIEDDLTAILAAEGGPHLTWNPGGCQLEVGLDASNNRRLLQHTDLLLLNREEALTFAKASSVDEALRTLSAAGARKIFVTDGRNGSIATDGVKRYSCRVIPATVVVDTTGAGDAFGTGATWALLQEFDLPTALQAGTINAANVVGAIGAQAGLLTDIEMRERLQQVHLDVEVSSLTP